MLMRITMIPFVPGNTDDDRISFIADARDAKTIIHAYITTAESVESISIRAAGLDTNDVWLVSFTRKQVLDCLNDTTFEDGIESLYEGGG